MKIKILIIINFASNAAIATTLYLYECSNLQLLEVEPDFLNRVRPWLWVKSHRDVGYLISLVAVGYLSYGSYCFIFGWDQDRLLGWYRMRVTGCNLSVAGPYATCEYAMIGVVVFIA